jgi:hypothetical protein
LSLKAKAALGLFIGAYSNVPEAVRIVESSFGGQEDTQVCEQCKEKVTQPSRFVHLD